MPRWVKVFVVITLTLLVILVISQVLGIQHRPGLHGALGAVPAVGVDILFL